MERIVLWNTRFEPAKKSELVFDSTEDLPLAGTYKSTAKVKGPTRKSRRTEATKSGFELKDSLKSRSNKSISTEAYPSLCLASRIPSVDRKVTPLCALGTSSFLVFNARSKQAGATFVNNDKVNRVDTPILNRVIDRIVEVTNDNLERRLAKGEILGGHFTTAKLSVESSSTALGPGEYDLSNTDFVPLIPAYRGRLYVESDTQKKTRRREYFRRLRDSDTYDKRARHVSGYSGRQPWTRSSSDDECYPSSAPSITDLPNTPMLGGETPLPSVPASPMIRTVVNAIDASPPSPLRFAVNRTKLRSDKQVNGRGRSHSPDRSEHGTFPKAERWFDPSRNPPTYVKTSGLILSQDFDKVMDKRFALSLKGTSRYQLGPKPITANIDVNPESGPKMTISKSLEYTPNLYAYPFKSNVDRLSLLGPFQGNKNSEYPSQSRSRSPSPTTRRAANEDVKDIKDHNPSGIHTKNRLVGTFGTAPRDIIEAYSSTSRKPNLTPLFISEAALSTLDHRGALIPSAGKLGMSDDHIGNVAKRKMEKIYPQMARRKFGKTVLAYR